MAAVHGSTTTAGNYLKKYYAPNMQYVNPEEIFPLWKEIKQQSKPVSGKGEGWVEAVKGLFGGGVGGYTETGTLPDPNFQNAQQGEVYPKGIAASFSITGKLMASADTDRAAFADGIDEVMNDCEDKFMRLQYFTAWSDGTHCLGGNVTLGNYGGGTNNKVTIDPASTSAPTLFLYGNVGDEVECFDVKAGTTQLGNGTTTKAPRIAGIADDYSYFWVDTTLDLTAVSSWATGYVFLKGARVSAGVFSPPDGLPNIIAASGAITGLNPATSGQEWWKSKVIDLGGATPPTRALIHRMIRKMAFRNNARKPSHMIFNPVHAEDLVELYWGLYQETRGDKVRPGHGDFAEWQIPGGRGVKMMDDDYCLPGKFWFPAVKDLCINWLRKPEFLDKGALPAIRMENYDIWKGHMAAWYNLFPQMRPAHGLITNSVSYTTGGELW